MIDAQRASRRLASLFAAWAARLDTDGVEVRETPHGVAFVRNGEVEWEQDFVAIIEDQPDVEGAAIALRSALDGLQDAVTIALTSPWPSSGGRNAAVHVEAGADSIELGFAVDGRWADDYPTLAVEIASLQ